MDRFLEELELGKVLSLVAAHAKSGVGRLRVSRTDRFLAVAETDRLVRLSLEVESLLEQGGTLPLAGIDDALPWLDPATPVPVEPSALLDLLNLARRVAAIRRRLFAAPGELGTLRELSGDLPDTDELVHWAAPRLGRDGTVPDDATPTLARLRRSTTRLRLEIVSHLEGLRRAHGDVVTDAPPTLRRDRYCLPVRAGARARLPGLLLDVSGSGATAFVEPFEAVDLNNQLAHDLAREAEEVRRILAEIAHALAEIRGDLAAAVDVLAELDAAQAKVLFGRVVEGRLVCPEGGELSLRGARHPLLDQRLAGLRRELFGASERRVEERRVVPLDFRLPEGVTTLVVSGPNAGGKTVVLKTVGLMVAMAALGVPIPAEAGSRVPRLRRLWCHIGDEQDVASDLSTFSGAMAATAELLDGADPGTLVLYDELGAGTDPLEGAALGLALLEELTRRRCLTVASTHLAAIALAASAEPAMDNAAMEYDDATERPTYRLRLGRPGRSRGLEIAHRMGVHGAIVERARELLGGQHLELEHWLDRLERLEGELEAERRAAAAATIEVERLQRRAVAELEQLEHERRELPRQLIVERDRLRRRAQDRLDAALGRLDEALREHRELGRRQRQRLRDEALDLEPPAAEPATVEAELSPGVRVRVGSLGGVGELAEERGSRALVVIGGKRLWVERADLQLVAGDEPSPKRSTVVVETGEVAERELKLLGLDSERAREDLERFLDQAYSAGARSVRVVHGHGTGTLRRMVDEVCRRHPAVQSFRHPSQRRGGSGVTEIDLAI